jgi:hypothetical protein
MALMSGCGTTQGSLSDDDDSFSTDDDDDTSEVANDDDTADLCPSVHFLDLDQFDGAGDLWEDPWLEVTCDEDTVHVESNGIPHFAFVQTTPNQLAPQDWNWDFPRHPQVADDITEIPLLGDAGVAVNGLPFYGPNEGAFPDPFGDPIYNAITDSCLGHTANRGDYHFHALLVECLSSGDFAGAPSPIIGYAFDGFPVYGPQGCVDLDCEDVVEFRSGWDMIGDPTTYAWDAYEFNERSTPEYLDECNGRYGPDGSYRYHATNNFPYILSCYRGTPTAGATGGDGGPDGGGPDDGGNPGGPPTCEEEADCADACPAGALGCTCHERPMGDSVCVPTCTSDSDCDLGGPVPLTCMEQQGVCVPQQGPGGM